jgi:hypothetical protein
MASCSEIEMWLSTLGTGMAGLRLLKEYGIRTPELEYFIENISSSNIEISAFAPPPLRSQYEPLFSQANMKLKSGIKKLADQNVSDEVIDNVLNDARALYIILSDMHKSTVSGIIIG